MPWGKPGRRTPLISKATELRTRIRPEKKDRGSSEESKEQRINIRRLINHECVETKARRAPAKKKKSKKSKKAQQEEKIWSEEEIAQYNAANPDKALGNGIPREKRNALQHLITNKKTQTQFIAPELDETLQNIRITGLMYPTMRGPF